MLFADKLMEVRILRANGAAYQDLFVEVMTLRYSDFRPVKPQGNIGDRKNDGYRPSEGIYYQVYAPEDPDSKIATAVDKIQTDFDGLKQFWNSLCPISSFYFVFNDKFHGAYPTIEATLLAIKEQHRLKECQPFLAKDLTSLISELDERNLRRLIGSIPSTDAVADLDFGIFSDVLRHVIANAQAATAGSVLTVPDFAEKIRLNKISPSVAALLTTASLQSGAVESFFSGHGDFSKTAIRNKLAQIYADVRTTIGEQPSAPGNADLVFFALLDAVTPHPVAKSAQDAAMVLLAYFFESCDIYEDPKRISQPMLGI
jgi:hypothetical protein